jgi:hypothetical protein
MEAPFLPPVSAGLFWCLVFDVPYLPSRFEAWFSHIFDEPYLENDDAKRLL